MSNCKRWVFTLNNPDGTIDADISGYFDGGLVDCVAYQHEVGANGTPHLQGLVVFKSRVRLAACRRFLPGAHFEVMRGTFEQALEYSHKEDTRDPAYEPILLGEPPSSRQGARSDLTEVKRKLDEGAKETQIADEHFASWVRYNRSFRDYKRLKVTPRDFKTEVTVIVGPTGTGKSTYANQVSSPDQTYFKQNSQWWDDYDGQETVVLDDFYGWLKYDFMLRLMDRYPMIVETKGGQTQFLAKNLIITSNAMPTQWYQKVFSDGNAWAPFKRRIDKWMYLGTQSSFVTSDYDEFVDRVNQLQ